MNKILTSFLSLAMVTSAQASIFDYTVYTTSGIDAKCGDYLGKTGSAGPIRFEDILIKKSIFDQPCALQSGSSVQTLRGKIMGLDGKLSCIAAPKVRAFDTELSYQDVSHEDFLNLSYELTSVSYSLSSLHNSTNVKKILLNLTRKTIEISANSDTTVILTSPETNINLVGYGIKLSGGVSAKNIVWHLPNAQYLTIANSGMNPNDSNAKDENGNHIGIPGTIVAPNANVVFNNALVTGAVYAKSIESTPPAGRSCKESRVYAGQVNPTCLETSIPGLGCGSSVPVPTPTPVQPTPTPTPTPFPTPNCNPQQQEPCSGQQQQNPWPHQQPQHQQPQQQQQRQD